MMVKYLGLLCLFSTSWLFATAVNDTQSGTNDNTPVICSQSANNCFVTCDANSGEICGDSSGSNGATINCPTTNACQLCEITCSGDYGCASATIEGYNCNLVKVNIVDGSAAVARSLTINAPGNDGNVQIYATGFEGFKDGVINDVNGTNNIFLQCQNGIGANECTSVTINGESAKNVTLDCMDGTYCKDVTVYCPRLSDLDYTSCNIKCDAAVVCTMDVYIEDNSWQDNVNFICTNAQYCNDDKLYCGYDGGSGPFDSCLLNGTSCNPISGTACQPTMMPTSMPTKQPSSIPTITPTLLPTYQPSSMPTTEPTIPTSKPTSIPTSNPTKMPTIMPTTMMPTSMPTSMPTRKPSDMPSFVPTTMPSEFESTTHTTNVSSMTSGGDPTGQSSDSQSSDATLTAVFIVAGVLGILLIACIGFLIYWTNRQKKESANNSLEMGQGENIKSEEMDVEMEMEQTQANKLRTNSNVVHTNDDEKAHEYVTPGGPDTGAGNNKNNEDSDTSQSSEEEMEAIRNKVVIDSLVSGVTPGGPNTDANDNESNQAKQTGTSHYQSDDDDDIIRDINQDITPGGV